MSITKTLTLRPIDDSDIPLIIKWLNKPYILKWYKDPESWINEIKLRKSKYSYIKHFIVQINKEDVGFCQYYLYQKGHETWHGSIPLIDTYSVDYFLGEEKYLHQGYGKEMVVTLSEKVFLDTKAKRIIVKPEENNIISSKTLTASFYIYSKENRLFLLERNSFKHKDISYQVFTSRDELYAWFKKNHLKEKELFLPLKKGNPNKCKNELSYIDAVEVALCFGWIDSTWRKIDGRLIGRLTPRKNKNLWSELNKERMRRLIKIGDMTEYGLKVAPPLDQPFIPNQTILNELKKDVDGYNFFLSTPKLYQNIRLYNVEFYMKKSVKEYRAALSNLINKCHEKKMYGEWNDFSRLINY